ncbi:MAG: hypothetical protein IPJ94_10990 [Chloroflexi bacterium]|nr:hypothetical protein [Chloroflexota bacterium]
MRVPWAWGSIPAWSDGGDYRVKSYEGLLQAWQAQAARERELEQARAEEEEAEREWLARGDG